MRPRTATIQVYKDEARHDDNMWYVEIGNPGDANPKIITKHRILDIALVNAVINWKEEEGLGD